MKKDTSRTLLLVVLAFVLFAAGFVGFQMYQQSKLQEARNQVVPSLPPVK